MDGNELLTHACRNISGLYFMAHACEKRRSYSSYSNPYIPSFGSCGAECTNCPGCLPREDAPAHWERMRQERESRGVKVDNRQFGNGGQLLTPYSCECGERNPKKYRAKRRSRCRACENADIRRHEAKKRKAKRDANPVILTGRKDFRYLCPIHGKHNGAKLGLHQTSACAKCVNAKRAAYWRERRAQCTT